MDYDPGRGGWGAQAQRAEIERKREMEERYNDAQDVPGAVAGGGGDWKESSQNGRSLKRARSPDDDGDAARVCAVVDSSALLAYLSYHLIRVIVCVQMKQTSRLSGCN